VWAGHTQNCRCLRFPACATGIEEAEGGGRRTPNDAVGVSVCIMYSVSFVYYWCKLGELDDSAGRQAWLAHRAVFGEALVLGRARSAGKPPGEFWDLLGRPSGD